MSYFQLAGDPQVSGSRLTWGAVLDPGSFELAAAGSTYDAVDAFHMTADDAAGLSRHADLVWQAEIGLPHDVMPGDSYQSSVDLDLRDGYYHVVLSIDGASNGSTYELHVRVNNGSGELMSWHQTM